MAEVLATASLTQGCDSAIDLMNSLPTEILSEICHNVLAYLQFKTPAISLEDLKENCTQNNIDISDNEFHSIINALKHIYRTASQHKLPYTELNQNLTSSLKYSEKCSKCIAESWKETGDSLLLGSSHPLFDVGKLVDMQWKLGVAVSSDSCKNLNAAFVTMMIKVANSSGQLSTHTFEMTIPQFKNLSSQLQDMAKSMEMV